MNSINICKILVNETEVTAVTILAECADLMDTSIIKDKHALSWEKHEGYHMQLHRMKQK